VNRKNCRKLSAKKLYYLWQERSTWKAGEIGVQRTHPDQPHIAGIKQTYSGSVII
jgi:hypothetical protein